MTKYFLSKWTHFLLLDTIATAAILGGLLTGCSSSSETPIAKIGDYSLSLKEYEKQYIRNNGGVEAAQKSTMDERKEFLNLLVKYRLKVLEAKASGYDKDPEIIKELTEYRNSLAIPYLTERELIDPKIKIIYNRKLEDVRAAHILVRIEPDSTGKTDTLATFEFAKSLLKRALAGENFDSLAVKYSKDPNTAPKGGDLLYFAAGMTAPVFDNAVYSLKTGQIYPELVRTMFGYHIVKLLDKKPARGEIEVSHILLRVPQDKQEDSTKALEQAKAIIDSLNAGGDFKELARRNSEDPQSGANGGDMGWVGRRRFVPEFEAAAFALKPGQISDPPVKTMFGYHIIKVTGERSVKPYDESRQELKDLYRRYGFDEDNQNFLGGIVSKYTVTVNPQTFDAVVANVDTTSTTSAAGWYNGIPETVKQSSLISLKGKNVSVEDIIKTIERNKDVQSKPLNRRSLAEVLGILGQKEALQLETANLEERYPEFADLMLEYREGVLLFRSEQEAVWNKVSINQDDLKKYWEEHKSDYQWPKRVSFREIFVTNDSLGKVLRDSLNAGVDFEELAARQTQRAGYKEKKGDWGYQPESANDLSKKAFTMQPGWLEGPMKFQYGYSIIKMEGKQEPREKTFEEAQSEVSSKFQEVESKRLEHEWIESLRKKYGVTIHDEALKNAFQETAVK